MVSYTLVIVGFITSSDRVLGWGKMGIRRNDEIGVVVWGVAESSGIEAEQTVLATQKPSSARRVRLAYPAPNHFRPQ